MSKTDILKSIKRDFQYYKSTDNVDCDNIEVTHRDFKQIFYFNPLGICYRYDIIFNNNTLFEAFKNTYNPSDNVYIFYNIKLLVSDNRIVYLLP